MNVIVLTVSLLSHFAGVWVAYTLLSVFNILPHNSSFMDILVTHALHVIICEIVQKCIETFVFLCLLIKWFIKWLNRKLYSFSYFLTYNHLPYVPFAFEIQLNSLFI